MLADELRSRDASANIDRASSVGFRRRDNSRRALRV
jgi:hypothetical protein